MAIDIRLPKLGLTMTAGTIVQWCRQPGEPVRAGEVLAVFETEKITYEIEAPQDGFMGPILVPTDTEVPVGTLLTQLLESGEQTQEVSQTGRMKVGLTTVVVPKPVMTAEPASDQAPAKAHSERVRATPLAKKIARQRGIDLRSLQPSGQSGRIVAADVEDVVPMPEQMPRQPVEREHTAEPKHIASLSSMRRIIAENMLSAKQQTAQTYMSISVDATGLQEQRQILLPLVEKQRAVRLTLTDLMMKITAAAIREHPVINTQWTDEGILYLTEVHMGMAMALEHGLIVPVVRNINQKGLGQIAYERTQLIAKGRQNKLLPDDIRGSTFTLSTLGMFGVESFTANINQPESAILAVGAIVDKAVVLDKQICVRPMMNITLTYDHRIIDGAEAGKFMRTLRALIQEPIRLLA